MDNEHNTLTFYKFIFNYLTCETVFAQP